MHLKKPAGNNLKGKNQRHYPSFQRFFFILCNRKRKITGAPAHNTHANGSKNNAKSSTA